MAKLVLQGRWECCSSPVALVRRLVGSVFHGHTKLDALDVVGVLAGFAASKSNEQIAFDTGLSRRVVGDLLDRLRMAATLVVQSQRDELVFSNCQVEADETVVRKERIYEIGPDGTKRRSGTIHHSVLGLMQRGSTKAVLYFAEPKFVPVAENGKPSPPSLPTTSLVLPMLAKHFGKWVVLHTDGAEAYAAACRLMRLDGFSVRHDSVAHSRGQFTAFGRHDVSDDPNWEGAILCTRTRLVSRGCVSLRAATKLRARGGT